MGQGSNRLRRPAIGLRVTAINIGKDSDWHLTVPFSQIVTKPRTNTFKWPV